MKVCLKCKQLKELRLFYKNRTKKDGYQIYCSSCLYEMKKTSLLKIHGHHMKEYNRRSNYVRYGITPEDYDELFLLQDGVCAICKKPSKKRLSIDHDHKTGIVRGLLCHHCNKGVLGESHEEIQTLQNAIQYLQFHALTGN